MSNRSHPLETSAVDEPRTVPAPARAEILTATEAEPPSVEPDARASEGGDVTAAGTSGPHGGSGPGESGRGGSGWGGLTVRSWFVLAGVLVGVLTLTGAFVVNDQLDRTARASDRLVDTIAPAEVAASRLQVAMLNQETGVRGYALSGDQRFLQPYTDGLAAEQEAAARLRQLLAREPRLRADLTAGQQAVAAWRRDYGTVVIAQVTKDGPGSKASAIAAHGKPAFDAVRATWDAQNRDLAQARADGRAELRHTRVLRNWTLVTLFAVLLVTVMLLAVLLHFAVDRPLRTLRTASRRVADGDFNHVIGASGPADVRDVALAVEAMRGRIKQALDLATESERSLRQQTAELDAQTMELRRSNAELEQFAYVASHDLQEPLRKVASFTQMLERRYADQLDDRARQYIGFAVDGAKRMQVLINDLLTFSRVGRLNQQRQELMLGDALERALGNLDEAIESSGARVEAPDDLPRVDGDPTLLAMLWQNLVGNAVKFRSPDRAPAVSVGCEREGDHWHLTVTDNGIGIPAEYQDKIFVIFQRLHGRDAYTGTGIGLALCKKIVEFHGGRIWLDPEYGPGARFHFTLPALEEPEPEPEPSAAAEDGDPDAERAEAGQPDGEQADSDQPDAEQSETGQSETGQSETGQSETGQAETGQADAGQSETGQADAGQSETDKADGEQADTEQTGTEQQDGDGERRDGSASSAGTAPPAAGPSGDTPPPSDPQGASS
ncbi:ATP-binding protein [Actinomadura logoneensis]|uniref:ATP-binding protein n=1 Tax=Actinomadura logoneensis TaxID=2293572 RepID=UPI0018F254D1|nr:ATP-binding protein [Actinomadura logoneensis]